MGTWRIFYDFDVDCVGSASEGGLVYADWWGILGKGFLTHWFFRKKSSSIHSASEIGCRICACKKSWAFVFRLAWKSSIRFKTCSPSSGVGCKGYF